jgi:hypothetical protein
LRRSVAFLAIFAALASVSSAAADLQPIRRGASEAQVPLLRAGMVQIPKAQRSGLVRVIVRLREPALAARLGRGGQVAGAAGRLDVTSSSSRAYIARLVAAQRAAARTLKRAIPEARVGTRFQIVLNGMTVTLPVTRLPKLARLSFATKIYPSLRYTLALNQRDRKSVV